MSDLRFSAHRGMTIRWREAVSKTLDDGTVQPVDLTTAGTKLIATGRLHPDDAAPLFTYDYYQAGGAPNGGISVPAPGQGLNSVAEIKIPPTGPGILALTKTTYVLVTVELIEQDGTQTVISTGVLKVRVP